MDFRLARDAPFSFTCRACGRCCADKVIMAGPHEVLGMSRLLGISTTEFLARYSDNGGTTLRFGEDGRCVFLTLAGCKVYPRRPLVCRLYPLGRATDGTGEERFAMFPTQEGCEAEFGTDGTIAGFLGSQEVEPYLEWSRRYGELYRRMMGLLERLDVVAEVSVEDRPNAHPEEDRAPLSSWQDIDASLAEYCGAKGTVAPAGVEEAVACHLRAIGEWLDDLEGRAAGRECKDREGASKT